MARGRGWKELVRTTMSPEAIAAGEAGAEEIILSMRLGALRKARGLTQEELADRLAIRQESVSRLESRNDARVSTLRTVAEAMGGQLDVRVRFPDGAEYRIELGDTAEVARVTPPDAPAEERNAA